MSLFGDRTFKQEIYDSLHYIIHNFNPEVIELMSLLRITNLKEIKVQEQQ
ncbi:hypothetical protein ACQKNX_22725 [Lysinibacillus sp. NPDC093712]